MMKTIELKIPTSWLSVDSSHLAVPHWLGHDFCDSAGAGGLAVADAGAVPRAPSGAGCGGGHGHHRLDQTQYVCPVVAHLTH